MNFERNDAFLKRCQLKMEMAPIDGTRNNHINISTEARAHAGFHRYLGNKIQAGTAIEAASSFLGTHSECIWRQASFHRASQNPAGPTTDVRYRDINV